MSKKINLQKVTRDVLKGNIEAIEELSKYIKRSAPLANKYLRELEKADFTQYAYARAMHFLDNERDSTRFSSATKSITKEQLVENAEEIHNFLSSPTHTVAGSKKAYAKQMSGIQQMIDAGYNLPTDKEDWAKVSRILGNDGMRFTNEFKYELIDKAFTALQQGMKEEEIEQIFLKYSSGLSEYNDILKDLGYSGTSTLNINIPDFLAT